MTKEIVKKPKISSEDLNKVLLKGDLSPLTPAQKLQYYQSMCEYCGLDPITKPFDLLDLKGKQVLYLNKSGAEQLRDNNGVSVYKAESEQMGDLFVYRAYGRNKNGREDVGTGAVPSKGLAGDALANALLKAETKAKRRLTLSLCGLGLLDETEVEAIPGAKKMEVINKQTGEVIDIPKPLKDDIPDWLDLKSGDQLRQELEEESLANPTGNYNGYAFKYELGKPKSMEQKQIDWLVENGFEYDTVEDTGDWYANEFVSKLKDKIRGPKK